MKKLIIVLAALLLPLSVFAAEQTLTMNVSGNCGSCKKTIVKAALSVEGVEKATWDKKTKVFQATFDDTKASKALITDAILKSGYDVEDKKAKDSDYDKLADCCRYRDHSH